MDVLSSPPPPQPNIRKRPAPDEHSPSKKPLNLKGDQFMMPSPPDTDRSNHTSPDDDRSERAGSPAGSSNASVDNSEITSNNALLASCVAGAASTSSSASTMPATAPALEARPAKRRKLTPSEKLEQAQAREAKQRVAAEKKATAEQKKAEAEAAKAEKKAAAEKKKAEDEAAKAEKKAAAEAKKREKEAEEERKAQEKLAKERKQMRLGAFFQGKPSTPAKGTQDGDERQPRTRRKSLSLEPFDAVADQIKSSASSAKGTPASAKKAAISDYRRTFLDFELPSHTTLAPRVQESEVDQDRFDHELNDPSLREKYDLGLVSSYASLENYFGGERARERGIGYLNIRKIVEVIQGTSSQVIDLTEEDPKDAPVELLRKIPNRLIQFHEDVRPAYCGTYTKIRSPRTIRRASRNPFTRARPDTNYDEDSEAEWEEGEEGDEEILDDEEDEAESQGDAGEMADFLDDEEEGTKGKRKMITGDLVPGNTGLCWENDVGRIRIVDSSEVSEPPAEISGMRIGFLIPGFSGQTIDPFSTEYWNVPTTTPAQPSLFALTVPASSGLMAPPRVPLQPKLNFGGSPQNDLIGASQGHKGPITTAAALLGAKCGPKPAPKMLSDEDLQNFKDAVVGSPLGKLELQKGLKSRFPKITNDAIKENLNGLFAQKGTGKDKHWVYVGNS